MAHVKLLMPVVALLAGSAKAQEAGGVLEAAAAAYLGADMPEGGIRATDAEGTPSGGARFTLSPLNLTCVSKRFGDEAAYTVCADDAALEERGLPEYNATSCSKFEEAVEAEQAKMEDLVSSCWYFAPEAVLDFAFGIFVQTPRTSQHQCGSDGTLSILMPAIATASAQKFQVSTKASKPGEDSEDSDPFPNPFVELFGALGSAGAGIVQPFTFWGVTVPLGLAARPINEARDAADSTASAIREPIEKALGAFDGAAVLDQASEALKPVGSLLVAPYTETERIIGRVSNAANAAVEGVVKPGEGGGAICGVFSALLPRVAASVGC